MGSICHVYGRGLATRKFRFLPSIKTIFLAGKQERREKGKSPLSSRFLDVAAAVGRSLLCSASNALRTASKEPKPVRRDHTEYPKAYDRIYDQGVSTYPKRLGDDRNISVSYRETVDFGL